MSVPADEREPAASRVLTLALGRRDVELLRDAEAIEREWAAEQSYLADDPERARVDRAAARVERHVRRANPL